ncbi:MAG TPA: helix-turn-helix transcriptional regulator [Anaerolineae bacterium]
MNASALSLASFITFGDLLKFLRRRTRLTQLELSIAVGYSEAHISRLEHNQRLPDLATIAALFVPALELEDEPEVVARLLELAAAARSEPMPAHGISLTRTEARLVSEEIEILDGSPPDNLPLQLTSFIGREREMEEVERPLTPLPSPDVLRQEKEQGQGSRARLLTLTGAGGSGAAATRTRRRVVGRGRSIARNFERAAGCIAAEHLYLESIR